MSRYRQKIDRLMGVPVCLLLTLLRRVLDCFGPPLRLPTRSILIVKLAEQGSTYGIRCDLSCGRNGATGEYLFPPF